MNKILNFYKFFSLLKLKYQKQNKPKDFGKIALRKDANSITATYFKNNTRKLYWNNSTTR